MYVYEKSSDNNPESESKLKTQHYTTIPLCNRPQSSLAYRYTIRHHSVIGIAQDISSKHRCHQEKSMYRGEQGIITVLFYSCDTLSYTDQSDRASDVVMGFRSELCLQM